MFYCSNAYGSVFNIEVEDKRVKGRLCTSDKNKDGDYISSFWNVVFVGGAYDLAKSLTDKCRVHINSCKISNEAYTTKDGKKSAWLQVTVFDFEKLEHDADKYSSNNTSNDEKSTPKKGKGTKKAKAKPIEEKVEELAEDELPF